MELGGKLLSPARKRAAVTEFQAKLHISERRACKAIDQPRSSQRFKATPRSDEAPLVKRMLQLARARPRFGYRRIGGLPVLEGWRAGAVPCVSTVATGGAERAAQGAEKASSGYQCRRLPSASGNRKSNPD